MEIEIKTREVLFLPVMPFGATATNFIGQRESKLLFFPKEKMSLSVEVNRKIYEYGINHKKYLKSYINYRAIRDEKDSIKY